MVDDLQQIVHVGLGARSAARLPSSANIAR